MTAHTPRNVLVTGGCGFIGSNFVNYIYRAWSHAHIVNVDKLILNSDVYYVDEEVIHSPRYKLVTADIRNRTVIGHVLSENQVKYQKSVVDKLISLMAL